MRVNQLPITKMPYRNKEPMPTFEHRFFVWCITTPQNLGGQIGNLTIPIDNAIGVSFMMARHSLQSPFYQLIQPGRYEDF